jgi:glycosyltransferase involved in cell wall biosynthesis
MKIILDFTSRASGGGLTFQNHFISNLAGIDNKNNYYLFTSAEVQFQLPSNFNVQVIKPTMPYELWKILWYNMSLNKFIKKEGIDLFYGATGISPLLLNCPSILSLQNLWPFSLDHSSLIIKIKKNLNKEYIKKSSDHAALLHFPSVASFNEYIQLGLRIEPNKARIVHFGIGEHFLNEAKSNDVKLNHLNRLNRPINFEHKEYILFVGNIFRHKNITTLIKAFKLIGNNIHMKNINLVIAGRVMEQDVMDDLTNLSRKLDIYERLLFIGEINYLRLPTLYTNAKMFISPSELETFGFPMVEAMASGTPIITADIPISREICGDAALYFPTYDEVALASLISKLWQDDASTQDLIDRGYSRAKSFTWKEMAKNMVSLFEEAVELHKPKIRLHGF